MELIKGKWYKNLGELKDHIGKFDGWHSLNIISVSEYIYKGKLHGYSECFTEAYKFAKECPLSEIQQYLPEGHPDKEFVLPEGWFVKCISQEEVDTVETYLFGSPIDNIYLPKYITNKGVSGPGHNSSYYKGWNCKGITFEQFKKYVLKQDDMKEKPIYVKVVDLDEQFPAHPKAREYGMVNYHYWTPGSARLNLTAKYRVVREIVVNGITESYILLDESTGYEYLIGIKGCEIIKDMEREIIGYKLKEDCKQYEEAAKKIAGYTNGGYIEFKDYLRQVNNGFISSLKKVGVLDLWFEPVFKEEFKIGDWVMETWRYSPYFNKKAFRVNSIINKTVNYNRDGGGCRCDAESLRLATPEEIEKTLVEEAIERGFKEGVKIKSLIHNKDLFCNNTINGFEYYPNYDELHFGSDRGSYVVIYEKGKWAEILPGYPQIEINGYEGEFFDDYAKFGCAKIDKEIFIRLQQLGQGIEHCNKELESATIGKGTFTKDQIKLIADYYLNKK